MKFEVKTNYIFKIFFDFKDHLKSTFYNPFLCKPYLFLVYLIKNFFAELKKNKFVCCKICRKKISIDFFIV